MSAATMTEPVRASDRVNDVLARDEALVEVFVRHSEHFTKLRNRTMRKIMGRLVTVEDAARMAAVPLETLLRDLNHALGIATATSPASSATSASSTAAPASGGSTAAPANRVASDAASSVAAVHPTDAPVVEVDVRDDLRAGREPLARIMGAVGALHDGEALRVRAIFEPVPLFTLLGKRGFLHESVEHSTDDWSVWFWRNGAAAAANDATPERVVNPEPAATATPANEPIAASVDANTVLLDVRGLQPPEPLMRTLAALEALPDGHQLLHVNSRVPQLLLPMLAERGFACELDESRADQVLLRIWRPA